MEVSALRALVPPEVASHAARGPGWAAWTTALPRLLGDLLGEWSLVVDGPSMHGHTAVVVPVLARTGPAVLKVAHVEEDSEHESLALQRWGGRGAVRLLQADPRRGAMLLERLPGPDLGDLWDVEACEVVAGLYAALHVPAPPQLRRLSSCVERWTVALAALPRSAPVPRRMVDQAVSLGRDLASDPGTDGVLLHTDLHYGNVLAAGADATSWLAIDPKPLSGDRHHEPAPMLWNRWEEVVASGDVRDTVRRRFHTLVDAADLDEDRARDWVVVRMLVNVLWALDDAEPSPDWITRCITVAKAVQD